MGRMGSYGELFPGRKLKHEGGQGSAGREHDPGGPLDLDRGVVFLAPPAEQGSGESAASESAGTESAGTADSGEPPDPAEPDGGAASRPR